MFDVQAMDQYFLCLLNGSLSEKDYVIITKYLNAVFPTSFQYQYVADFAESVAVLLKPISKHVAVLNTYEENDNIIWNLYEEGVNILAVIEDGVAKTNSAFEFDSQNASDYISALLHSLADQLPAFGTYRLDILLGSDVLRELSISKEPMLAGAFIRLTRWHSAHFTIFQQKEFDSDRLNEWCEIINAQILLHDVKLNLGPTLWRGAVQYQCSNTKDVVYNGFELYLDLDENDCSIFHAAKGNTKQQVLEHVILSSKLQVIDEIIFASIPSYLISPMIFRLHLSRPNIFNENSSNFLEYLLNNEKAAFIVKLGFAEIKEKIKPERKYCSSRWQKAVFSGYVKDSECFVSSFEKFITFVITKSSNSDYIVAYPLQDPKSLDANFYFSIVNYRVSNMRNQVPEENATIEVPFFSGNAYQTIIKYLKQSKDHKNGSYDSKSNIDFSSFMENIRNSFPCSLFGKACSPDLSVEEIDPSDWPERIHLLYKQMKNEEEKECVPTVASLVQNFKLPQQSFSLSSDNMIKHFFPSGEPKNTKKLENVCLINNTDHLVMCNLNDIHQSKWPAIMNCIYHDLYYNSDCQAEDKESLGSQLVKLYVQHETASSCNNQQLTQKYRLIVPEKVSSPSKAFRGPSSRITNILNEKRHVRNSTSPNENTLKDLFTKNILSSSHDVETESSSKETSKRNLNKSLAPVRCSPRKKNIVNYKYPSVNRNNKSSNNLESNKMSDLLRKKIRCAVAKALEDNGINFTDPMFQPCGAKLFTICRTFLNDLKLKRGKTSEYLQKIADAHVKQVIEFYQDCK